MPEPIKTSVIPALLVHGDDWRLMVLPSGFKDSVITVYEDATTTLDVQCVSVKKACEQHNLSPEIVRLIKPEE